MKVEGYVVFDKVLSDPTCLGLLTRWDACWLFVVETVYESLLQGGELSATGRDDRKDNRGRHARVVALSFSCMCARVQISLWEV